VKYPCLVLDHDDTVVQSESTINYPYFCYILNEFRPGKTITLEEYVHGCCDLGFAEMCKQWYAFTDEEMEIEYQGWKAYIMEQIPAPFPGIKELILKQKELGGLVCVVSHSSEQNIIRDYTAHFGVQPDCIFGWDYPEHQRKPNPYPLLEIMNRYSLAPGDLLVVDDMKPAYDMAKAAGVDIAFAGWGRKDYPRIYAQMQNLCNYTFDTPEELSAFLF
jgi:phosphoglycolate phosphatase/pyrophosphatase PpaX